ncbi:DUF883 domain-containing protein [Undibacterium sp. Jales W-56]|uniref:DUF883 domain-containing protein n=1 Tax=Undibacterium sp. Jales W-56 TaxID=2897325 RepID=UPI0021D3953F|nr:DUF883 domain-containing protein [Undibacterium sp. Jales W-56]MCU6434003.1 DUF883 domain-containing protein [Undibacterium sp. Jales W-56]
MTSSSLPSNEKMIHDIKEVMADAEFFLRITSDQANGDVVKLHDLISARLADARCRLNLLEQNAVSPEFDHSELSRRV